MASKKGSSGTSEDTKTIVTVLLLLFVFPLGLVLMWFWTKWPSWIKLLISVPIIILGFLFIVGVFTVANQRSLDQSRMADVRKISDEAGHYCFEHNTCFQGKYDSMMEFINLTNLELNIPLLDKDSNYTYELTDGGKNCVIKSKLSSGEVYSINCMRFALD